VKKIKSIPLKYIIENSTCKATIEATNIDKNSACNISSKFDLSKFYEVDIGEYFSRMADAWGVKMKAVEIIEER
jgi:hypothetical protein